MVVDVAEDDALMADEIFGPILPILAVESLEKSIEFVSGKEKPLALYVFSDESSVRTLCCHEFRVELTLRASRDVVTLCLKVVKTVMEKTSSGGFCSNDAIVHMTLPSLPFGGIGRCCSAAVL